MDKAIVIGDFELVSFFYTIGIPGIVIDNPDKAYNLLLEEVKKIGRKLIIVSHSIFKDFREEIDKLNLSGDKIIFMFPDSEDYLKEIDIADKMMKFLGVSL